jgi:hypothetical protein
MEKELGTGTEAATLETNSRSSTITHLHKKCASDLHT